MLSFQHVSLSNKWPVAEKTLVCGSYAGAGAEEASRRVSTRHAGVRAPHRANHVSATGQKAVPATSFRGYNGDSTKHWDSLLQHCFPGGFVVADAETVGRAD